MSFEGPCLAVSAAWTGKGALRQQIVPAPHLLGKSVVLKSLRAQDKCGAFSCSCFLHSVSLL